MLYEKVNKFFCIKNSIYCSNLIILRKYVINIRIFFKSSPMSLRHLKEEVMNDRDIHK